jgi:hypothetical protein
MRHILMSASRREKQVGKYRVMIDGGTGMSEGKVISRVVLRIHDASTGHKSFTIRGVKGTVGTAAGMGSLKPRDHLVTVLRLR